MIASEQKSNPKRSIALACGGLLTLAVLAFLLRTGITEPLRADVPARPVLDFEHTNGEFGTVVEGAVLSTTFTLRNLGTRRLVVNEEVCRPCGSTGAPRTVIVKPGDSANITVSVDTNGVSGRLRHLRHYTTNDPDNPRFEILVSATVVAKSAAKN